MTLNLMLLHCLCMKYQGNLICVFCKASDCGSVMDNSEFYAAMYQAQLEKTLELEREVAELKMQKLSRESHASFGKLLMIINDSRITE